MESATNISQANQNYFYALSQALELKDILFADIDTYLLTADDIENRVNAVREILQVAIEDINNQYGITGQPMALSLQRIANLLVSLGKQLLLTSPIITTYTVTSDFEPACLISHKLYPDKPFEVGVAEIMRLNPTIRNPNFIMQGTALRVFAR